jgi:serine/threonine-protein kinase
VGVVDVGQDNEGPFLVMDYIDGVPLSLLIAQTAMPVAAACKVVMQVAEGLHAAHELKDTTGLALGIIHRDVSPQNILLGFDGVARLTDFGVARAMDSGAQTRTGVLKGKMSYMAPERLRFEPFDRRADLYALGVVLWEMLAGRKLYGASEGAESARRILHEPPPDIGMERDDVPAPVVELLFSVLAKDPALRPSTAAEVSQLLQAVLDAFAQEGETFDLAVYLSEKFDFLRHTRTNQIRLALAAPEHTHSAVTNTQTLRRPTQRWPWLLAGSFAAALGLSYLLLPRPTNKPLPSAPAIVQPTQASPPIVQMPEPKKIEPSPSVAKPAKKRANNKSPAEKLRLWQWR